MKYKSIFFISPPFYSHFNPLLTLAKSFKEKGAKVSFACSEDFKERIVKAGLDFYLLDISKNKNVGKAETTDQPDSEKERLDEFFQATKKGAIETLITQSKHRKADMLYSPDELIEKIKKIDDSLDIDLYVVDILSYSVSLSLYFLELDFITFCPPHPKTIPSQGEHFNVPNNWPSPIEINHKDLEKLKEISKKTQREFTNVFKEKIAENKNIKTIDNAFSLVSDIGLIYNYFDFYKAENIDEKPVKLYIGHCFEKEDLDEKWVERLRVKRKKIMITLGTFLSNRKDILEKLILGVKEVHPEALLIVSAGANAEKLKQYRSSNVFIEEFIPQKALIPYVDALIFHGGCNSFTEAMYYAKEMIILPFSSDQFNIAYDCQKHNLAQILDPNNFKQEDLLNAFKNLENNKDKQLEYWSHISKERGPDYASKTILSLE